MKRVNIKSMITVSQSDMDRIRDVINNADVAIEDNPTYKWIWY